NSSWSPMRHSPNAIVFDVPSVTEEIVRGPAPSLLLGSPPAYMKMPLDAAPPAEPIQPRLDPTLAKYELPGFGRPSQVPIIDGFDGQINDATRFVTAVTCAARPLGRSLGLPWLIVEKLIAL